MPEGFDHRLLDELFLLLLEQVRVTFIFWQDEPTYVGPDEVTIRVEIVPEDDANQPDSENFTP